MTTVSVKAPHGFRFAETVTSHGWYQLAPFSWDGEVLTRTEDIRGEVTDLRMELRSGRVTVDCPSKLSREQQSVVRERVVRMFQFDVPLDEFHRHCRKVASHRWVAKSGYGRLLCGATLFEDVVKIIATTNTAWSQTRRMIELLVERFGERSPSGRAAFPPAAKLAAAKESDLAACRFGYRSRYVIEAARTLATPQFEIALDRVEATPDRLHHYRSLPGIGPYGAAHLLAMEGRHDHIAVDTEFRRFVRDTYHGGRDVSDAAMLRRYASWGRWKYLAYWSELWGSSRG